MRNNHIIQTSLLLNRQRRQPAPTHILRRYTQYRDAGRLTPRHKCTVCGDDEEENNTQPLLGAKPYGTKHFRTKALYHIDVLLFLILLLGAAA